MRLRDAADKPEEAVQEIHGKEWLPGLPCQRGKPLAKQGPMQPMSPRRLSRRQPADELARCSR